MTPETDQEITIDMTEGRITNRISQNDNDAEHPTVTTVEQHNKVNASNTWISNQGRRDLT